MHGSVPLPARASLWAVQVATGSEWVRIVEAFDEGFDAGVVVAGAGAPEIAQALRRAGVPPLAVAHERLAVLSGDDVDEAAATLADLPASIAGIALLRRAWDDRLALTAALREANRVIRPGGRVIAADIDLDRLMGSSNHRYPARLQYLLAGDDIGPPRSLRMALSIETGRAGFRDVRGWEVDVERGVYPDARAYWQAVKAGGWPVLADLQPAVADRVLEDAAAGLRRIAPIGEVVDRYPWFVVTGVKP